MIEVALNKQNLGLIVVDMGASEEEGKRNLAYIFKDKNYLGCKHSTKKEAFKHLKVRVIVMGLEARKTPIQVV